MRRPVIRGRATVAAMTGTPNEQERWVVLLGFQFVIFGVGLAALFATGIAWLLLPLLPLPIGIGLTITYLAMSSDTNGQTSVRPRVE